MGPYTFVIDTDTTPSVIDLTLAEELKIRLGRAAYGSGIGTGRLVAYPVAIPQISLGSIDAQNLTALAADLSGLSTRVGSHIDGVLGTSFLNGRIVQINYPCRTLAFLSAPVASEPTARFRWNENGGNTIEDVWVGTTRVPATFDSGDGGFGYVTAKGIAELHLDVEASSGPKTTANGYLGTENATTGQIGNVRIGSFGLGPLETKFFVHDPSSFALNIGNRAVDQYVLTLDYVRGSITLAKQAPC